MARVIVCLARVLFTVILFPVAAVYYKPVGDNPLKPPWPKPRVLQEPRMVGHCPKDLRTAEVARLATPWIRMLCPIDCLTGQMGREGR